MSHYQRSLVLQPNPETSVSYRNRSRLSGLAASMLRFVSLIFMARTSAVARNGTGRQVARFQSRNLASNGLAMV